MNYIKYSALILIIAYSSSFAQENSETDYIPPSPVIGWDSLKSIIKYPDIYRRLGFEGAAVVFVELDSTGFVDTIKIYSNLIDFEYAIREAVKSTSWNPAIYEANKVRSQAKFNVHFFLNDLKNERLIIESSVPIINKDY